MCIRPFLFLAAAVSLGAAEPPLQLHVLVEEALSHNPEILAAQKRLEAVRQRPAQQSALPDPMISLGWNSSGNPLPGAGLGSQPTANIGVMASQEFPWPGKLRLRGDIARRDGDAEAEQYRTVELNVVSRLKQAYHRLHHAYVMQDLLERNRDLLRNLLSVTEARYSVGKAPQQDIFKAQTQLSVMETRVIQTERERHAREAEINSLLDRPQNSPLGAPPNEPVEPIGFTLEELQAKAGEAAPQLRRDGKMLERAETALNLAHKDYYPDTTLNAGYYNMGAMPPMYMFRADVRVPIYYRHKQRAAETEQAAGVVEARRTYEAGSQALLYKIKDDYLTAETAAKLLDIYDKTILPQARFAVDSSLASYENGTTDFLNVLNNYMAVFDAEMTYHEQMQEFHLALTRLEELTGVELMH
jgi:cobalt-zinc-cadmium efflux system outer membrane protein